MISTTSIAKMRAMNDNTIDSPKNCLIRSAFFAPTTFLIPTSLALVPALAVERFIKLIQAMISTKQAMIEKM